MLYFLYTVLWQSRFCSIMLHLQHRSQWKHHIIIIIARTGSYCVELHFLLIPDSTVYVYISIYYAKYLSLIIRFVCTQCWYANRYKCRYRIQMSIHREQWVCDVHFLEDISKFISFFSPNATIKSWFTSIASS